MSTASTKYELFDNEKDIIHKQRNTCCSPKMIAGIVTIAVVVFLLLVIISLLTIGLFHQDLFEGSKPKPQDQELRGVLRSVSVNETHLIGEYVLIDGSIGIAFNFFTTQTSIVLQIRSTNGSMIFSVTHSTSTNMTLVNINSTVFILMEKAEHYPNGSKYDDYMIHDETTMNMAMSALNGEREMDEEIFARLDNEGIDEMRHSMINGLGISDEAMLIIQAAESLGNDMNIQGPDSPIAMKFYVLAMKLANIHNTPNAGVSVFEYGYSNTRKQRRGGGVQCEAYDTTCPTKAVCPYKAYGNNCFGMCGPDCTCWWWVCGDCCIHQYCRTHDYCCSDEAKGFWSWDCISAAWNKLVSSCEDTFQCD